MRYRLDMVFSDQDIQAALEENRITFSPQVEKGQIGPASVDLRLGNTFLLFQAGRHLVIDPREPLPSDYMETLVLKEDVPFILHPQSFVIGATFESVRLPSDIRAHVDGKSTLARMGLLVHTAGFIDPGFEGNITLEFSNHGPLPIKMYHGMHICQLELCQLISPSKVSYDKRKKSRYNKSVGPVQAKTENLIPR